MLEGISVLAGVLFGGVTQYRDTKSLNHGEMSRKDYTVETSENVTGGVGVWAGVQYGSMLGSTILPGFGTVAGAVAGGLLGAKVGTAVGHQAGNAVVKRSRIGDHDNPRLFTDSENAEQADAAHSFS